MSLPNLDDLKVIKEIDPHGMIDLIFGFPEQCEKAAEIGSTYKPSSALEQEPGSVIILGLGGSAIAGDMLGSLVRNELKCSWETVRDYDVPNYVNKDTFVIAESYSGNTEETLSAYSQAVERGARVVCITSGGKLAELARKNGNDLLIIPSGQPPRSATGYMLIPMFFVLERLGIISGWTSKVKGAIDLIKSLRSRMSPDVTSEDNPAKSLARELYGRIPLIYGADGYIGILAVRWKGQLNENSKIFAFSNVFPELDHNEILGWERAELQSDNFSVVMLRDPADQSRIADRITITTSLIPDAYPVIDVPLEGKNDLERLLWGMHLGDFVSGYLAILNSVDPWAMVGIEYLKAELAKI